jgi:hypothetical protein
VEGAKKIGLENISSSTISKTLLLDPNNGDIFCKSLRAQRLKWHSDQALKTWTMHTQFDKVTNIPNCTMKQISREILIGKSPEWESWLVTLDCASKLLNFHLDVLETRHHLSWGKMRRRTKS